MRQPSPRVIARLAERQGRLVDLHAHFLLGEPAWFTRTIEPSLVGASEVRRAFLEAVCSAAIWVPSWDTCGSCRTRCADVSSALQEALHAVGCRADISVVVSRARAPPSAAVRANVIQFGLDDAAHDILEG